MDELKSKRVLVIGAGFAGLGAAWRLAERGVSVQLVEKRPRAGGSVFCVETQGFVFESRPYELCATDHALAAWLAALGLYGEWLPQHQWVTSVLERGALTPIDLDAMAGIARIPGVAWGEAWRTVRLPRLLQRYRENLSHAQPERAAAHDDRSLQDFITTYFGPNVFERWALPWLRSHTNCDAYHTSRVLFLREFVSRLPAPPARLRSGLGAITHEVTKRVPVQLDTEVSRVERSFDGKYRVCLRRGPEEMSLDVEAVICATGASEALRLAQAELGFFERRYLQNTRTLPRAMAYFGTDRSLADRSQRIFVSRAESESLGTVFLQAAVAPLAASAGVVAVCPRAEWLQENAHLPDEEMLDTIQQRLRPLFPALASMTRARAWLRSPEGSTQFQVGRYRELAQWQRIALDRRAAGRRLYLAGDYLCGPMLEDALLAGLRAADALLADLGVVAVQGTEGAVAAESATGV